MMESPRQHADFLGEDFSQNMEETPSLLVHTHRVLPGTSPAAESFKSAASDSPIVVASYLSPRFLEHANTEKEPSPQRPLMSLAAGIVKDHVSTTLSKAATVGSDAASPSSKEEDLSEGVNVSVSFPSRPRERPAALPGKDRKKNKNNGTAVSLSGGDMRPTLKRLSTIEEEDGLDSGSDKHECTADERNYRTDKDCRVPETGTAKLRQKQRGDGGKKSSNSELPMLKSQQENSAVRESFRFYWQCALENFGVTNMGMMLKADACEQGFASKDAQGVVDLILQHCVPCLLDDSRGVTVTNDSSSEAACSVNKECTVAATPSETLQKKQIQTILPRDNLDSSGGRFNEGSLGLATNSYLVNKNSACRLRKNSNDLSDIMQFQLSSTPRPPVQIAFVIPLKNDRLTTETCEYQTSNNVVPRFQSILELGAGIGRLTSMLQKVGRQIVAVDFVEDYVTENKKANGDPCKRPLDIFVVADATTVTFPVCSAEGLTSPRSFDLLVINWLLMYLTDEEVMGLLRKLLSVWSRRGSFLFIRESCTEPSDKGSQNRSWAVNGNPTLYRKPEQYTTWIHDVAHECGKEDLRTVNIRQEKVGVQIKVLVSAEPMTLYQREHGTDSQRCWLVRIMN
ncbi:methyltransferase domain-containing protein [Cystoisospora suis]|uniref:phosphoethanolamine N-methyltransferase n=1 Tax=Cystoisospora suis TaxID=483139 RepID=A0A2C6KRL0_9APIC|nr:methyltransferase domain-containing protein [Cystoisospora suis]